MLRYFGDASSNLFWRCISEMYWNLNRVKTLPLPHFWKISKPLQTLLIFFHHQVQNQTTKLKGSSINIRNIIQHWSKVKNYKFLKFFEFLRKWVENNDLGIKWVGNARTLVYTCCKTCLFVENHDQTVYFEVCIFALPPLMKWRVIENSRDTSPKNFNIWIHITRRCISTNYQSVLFLVVLFVVLLTCTNCLVYFNLQALWLIDTIG